MTEIKLEHEVIELLSLPAETEVVEFKEAKDNYDFTKRGRYSSALSNEANLSGKACAWLVFGVADNRKIVGSQYRINRADLDYLKGEIADRTTSRITFIEIHEVNTPGGRVVLFQIPAALQSIPVAFDGHCYGRNGENLGSLNIEEQERIRVQSGRADWSAVVVPTARLTDLAPDALAKARREYKKKNLRTADEVDNWDDSTFLNKARLAINGRLTRTALILLGLPESVSQLSPYTARISWHLRKEDGSSLDYEHVDPPLLLEVDRVLAKIRNLRYRYLLDNTLFPEELDMYDKYVIREALHNCIAHQDYALCERINVVEYPEHLLFDNAGNFIPGTIERVIEQDAPQSFYRNRFLVEAMVNLDMIDTTGSGIRRMFTKQRERFFPMPDYDLSNPQHVRLRIEGRIIDRNYSQLLRDQALTLEKVIWLDKIQKRKSTVLTDKQILILRQEGLIEGRKPNYYVSLSVAKQIGQEADYARNRVLSDEEYKAMIVVYLKDKPFATRTELNDLLVKQLSDLPIIQQKLNKITNLLSALRNDGLIANESAKKTPRWILISKEFINN